MALQFTIEELRKEVQGIVDSTMAKHLEAVTKDKAADAGPPVPVGATPVPQLVGKHCFGAICRAMAATKSGRGDFGRAVAYASNQLKRPDVAQVMEKAMQAGVGEDGGFLITPDVVPDLIEILRAGAVVRGLNPTLVPLVNGIASVTKLTAGSIAYYVGEGKNITPSNPKTGKLYLREHKLAVLVPISNDLIKAPSANTTQLVQEDVTSAITSREDLAFMRGSGNEYQPRGLEKWVPSANQLTCTLPAAYTLATVTTDLGRLMLQLLNSDVRMLRPGWLLSPRTWHYLATVRDGNGNFAFRDEIMQGRLWGFPFGRTTQIPINLETGTGTGDESMIYFADFADVIVADAGTLEIQTSSEAAYHDGSSVVAAFSQDETVLRAIVRHDIGLRHEESVASMKQIRWGA